MAITLEDMQSSSWQEFLAYTSPAVAALLYATAKWVESRARITCEVERSISQELALPSAPEPHKPDGCALEHAVPDQRKSSTKATTYTSPGEFEPEEL